MSNPIEQAHQALIDRLGKIVPSNGYLTDAGTRVREGWLADVLSDEDVAFPLLLVQPGDYRPAEPGPGVVLAAIGRRVVGVVDPGHPDGYRAALDELYVDIASCLQVAVGVPNPWGRPGPYQVVFEPGKLFPPGDGLNAGTLVFPVQLKIHIPGKC
jgi:hypothetical protein